jgi:hypothetical protein
MRIALAGIGFAVLSAVGLSAADAAAVTYPTFPPSSGWVVVNTVGETPIYDSNTDGPVAGGKGPQDIVGPSDASLYIGTDGTYRTSRSASTRRTSRRRTAR